LSSCRSPFAFAAARSAGPRSPRTAKHPPWRISVGGTSPPTGALSRKNGLRVTPLFWRSPSR
jgi:hypothetical protein